MLTTIATLATLAFTALVGFRLRGHMTSEQIGKIDGACDAVTDKVKLWFFGPPVEKPKDNTDL